MIDPAVRPTKIDRPSDATRAPGPPAAAGGGAIF
jgi:hypothetical protein